MGLKCSCLNCLHFLPYYAQGNNMNGSWFFDENFNGVPDDFFDDAIKYFDFPLEDVEPNDAVEHWETRFQPLVPAPSNVFAGLTAGLCGENDNDTLKIKNTSSILVSLINLFKVYFISVVNYMESVECCVLSFFNEEDNVLLQYFCLCVLL